MLTIYNKYFLDRHFIEKSQIENIQECIFMLWPLSVSCKLNYYISRHLVIVVVFGLGAPLICV